MVMVQSSYVDSSCPRLLAIVRFGHTKMWLISSDHHFAHVIKTATFAAYVKSITKLDVSLPEHLSEKMTV